MPISRTLREGIVAGLLGAGGVAAWFFTVDLIAGRPLYTPGILGQALVAAIGYDKLAPAAVNVAVYTAFHVAAFVAVGVIACKLVEIAHRAPHVTIGLLLFFVVFEVGFYLAALISSHYDVVGSLAWYQIGAANLVASALMGGYIWRHHPELKTEIRLALDGRA